jgi:hypothetical protein
VVQIKSNFNQDLLRKPDKGDQVELFFQQLLAMEERRSIKVKVSNK